MAGLSELKGMATPDGGNYVDPLKGFRDYSPYPPRPTVAAGAGGGSSILEVYTPSTTPDARRGTTTNSISDVIDIKKGPIHSTSDIFGDAPSNKVEAPTQSSPAGSGWTGVVGAGKGWTTITDAQGNEVRLTGARNWRNNNPGNIEYGPFARKHGAIGTDGRFAVFPSYEAGRAAKESLLFETPSYKNKTIRAAIARYAPAFENNVSAYAGAVANAIGVSPDTPLSSLTPEQRIVMLDAMQRVEGWKVGRAVDTKTGKPYSSDTSSAVAPKPTMPEVISAPDWMKPRPVTGQNYLDDLVYRGDGGQKPLADRTDKGITTPYTGSTDLLDLLNRNPVEQGIELHWPIEWNDFKNGPKSK